MPLYLSMALALFFMSSLRAARVLVTLLALELGAQSLAIGILGAMFALFPVLLSWLAGRIADRFGPRWPMTCAAVCAASALALPALSPTLPALFVCAALSGLALTFFNVTLQNLVGFLSDAETRARNFSNYAIAISVATGIGPLLAGVMTDKWGHAIALLGFSGLVLIPVALLLSHGSILPAAQSPSPAKTPGTNASFNGQIWPVLMVSGAAQSALESYYVFLPVYAHAQGLSATTIGQTLAMGAIGGLASRMALVRLIRISNEERVLAYSLVIAAAGLVALPFISNAVLLAAVALVFGFGVNCTQPVAMTLLYSRSPEGQSGAALGLRFSVDNGARLIAPILFGAVATSFGVALVFWANAIILCGASAKMKKTGDSHKRRD